MVQSSYKNRKNNQKQSFKRRATGGKRKILFIDEIVGGEDNKHGVAELMRKYKDYPFSGLILAAFSNATCASESECTFAENAKCEM